MSSLKPTKTRAAVGSRSRPPHPGAAAPKRDPLRRRDPASPRAAQHAEHDDRPPTLRNADTANRSPAADDSGHGLVLLTLTVGGSLTVVPAVWLIALAPAVWAAAFALLILVALAGAIVLTVLRATSS